MHHEVVVEAFEMKGADVHVRGVDRHPVQVEQPGGAQLGELQLGTPGRGHEIAREVAQLTSVRR
jgi:hypothetical protein